MSYGNCCGPSSGVARRYYSNAERTAWLEAYAAELDNELTAVKERIAALAKSSEA